MAWVVPALGFGSQVFGLISGKGHGGMNRELESGLREMMTMARNYDPVKESQAAIDQAMKDSEVAIRHATTGITGAYAEKGSRDYLPDTARESAIRGAETGIGRTLASYIANVRASATQKKADMMSQAYSAATGAGGRVRGNEFNAGGFATSFRDLINSISGGHQPSGSAQANDIVMGAAEGAVGGTQGDPNLDPNASLQKYTQPPWLGGYYWQGAGG